MFVEGLTQLLIWGGSRTGTGKRALRSAWFILSVVYFRKRSRVSFSYGRVVMAIPTLYDMCQFQTVVNMRAGLWSQCQENPFTKVPPKLIDRLWEFIFSLNFRQLPNHEALNLLFTSHRLKKLDLSCFFVKRGETFSADDPYAPPHLKQDVDVQVPVDERTGDEYSYYCRIFPEGSDIYLRTKKHMEGECNSLLYMLSKDPQPDLQSYIMTRAIPISKFVLQPLIQVSTNLTEIHTNLHWFDLNVVMNCKMLRILRLHASPRTRFFDCPKELLETCDKVLPSLENLEIFTICNRKVDCFGMHPVTAIALAHCPKLTSVGYFNSAMAIEFLNSKTNKSHTGCFRLKKCFWGLGASCESPYRLNELLNLKSNFPELIKTAVSCCPFVEELILQVINKDCLQHLRRLKRLNSLVLECAYYDDFEIDECLSLLGEIRHQLKHFVIKGIDRFTIGRSLPLNVVSDNCENLQTLAVLDNSAIIFPLKVKASFRFLKRICFVTSLDYLGQILRYCDNLTYLLMIGHFVVDESELRENLSHTSALKLQTLGINSPYFSEIAMRMVFEKAPNLEKVCFCLERECVSSLFKELGRSIVFDDKLLQGGTIYFLVLTLIVILIASSVNKSAELARDAIRCFAERFPLHYNKLNFYSHLQMKQKPSLTLWDIYKIDKSLLISVLGTLITYGCLVGTVGSVQKLKNNEVSITNGFNSGTLHSYTA
ncbi:uncharacterized protein CDAR_606331 [Caerostris darwini]|uniref:Uncharacterized protein n=1 Tax=Caerostris darwini TaxID=1538125 RepID=A0AAV4PAZ1_9ARAC|nr:uncharacterized protein CDAR_606331 [Caerostris darwini]